MCELQRADATEASDSAPGPERGVAGLVEELVVAVVNGRIYGLGHARVRASVQRLVETAEEILAERTRGELVLGRAQNYLFVDGRPLLGASLAAPRVIQPLADLGCGGLVLRHGASQVDFVALVDLLRQRHPKERGQEACNAWLKQAGCERISLLPPFHGGEGGRPDDRAATLLGASDDAAAPPPEEVALGLPVRLYQSVVDHMQDVMVDVHRGAEIDVDRTRHYVERVLEQLASAPRPILGISVYEQYDAFTFGHSIRVCFLALNFARTLTQDVDLLHRIGVAALLHDVGKAYVPFEILHSTARLTDAERVEMNKHTSYGAQMLIEMGRAEPVAVAAAYGHHLTQAGGGYPRTFSEHRTSTATRLVKICDVYEALTALRPYKDRMSSARAYRIMMSMDDHFDRALLRAFIGANGLYPVGSGVRLSSGETARVERQSGRVDAPVVTIETTREGDALAAADRRELDLSAEDPRAGVRVAEALLGTAAG